MANYVTDGEFRLDTANMDSVIKKVQDLAKTVENYRTDFAKYLTDATQNWHGKARNEFDIKAHSIMQQVTDISQSFYDIAEDLLNASTAYMQADTDLAKSMDGVQTRGTGNTSSAPGAGSMGGR